ncbi:MAG TPA: hypothetical protein PK323_07335 [Bacteroidia bacterium]|nr:hypothetical protein [Bacteroidia bacterium]
MKKSICFYLIIAFSLFLACKKKGENPQCIDAKINEFNHIISCNQGSNVKEYKFQSKRVFVFDPGNCGADMTSEVIDENCNSLGFLGGIAGNNTINGESFDNAKYVKTIWSR